MSFIKDPRYDRGRWYRIFLESDGTNYTVHENSIANEISGNHLKFKKGFHVITIETDYTFIANSGASMVETGLYLYADGTVSANLADASKFSSAFIYVFAYEE